MDNVLKDHSHPPLPVHHGFPALLGDQVQCLVSLLCVLEYMVLIESTLLLNPIPMAMFLVSKGLGQYMRQHFLDKNFQRSEEHTSELQSLRHLVCRLLLEK